MIRLYQVDSGGEFAEEDKYIITNSKGQIAGYPSQASRHTRKQAKEILRRDKSKGVRAFAITTVYEVGEELNLYDD